MRPKRSRPSWPDRSRWRRSTVAYSSTDVERSVVSSTDASRTEDARESSGSGDRTDEPDDTGEDAGKDADRDAGEEADAASHRALKLAALGLVAGVAGGVAGSVIDPGHPLLALLVVLAVVAGVTLLASRLSLRRLRPE